MITLYFLIPAVIVQIFNPSIELVTPKRTATSEANTGSEIYPLTAETKLRKSS